MFSLFRFRATFSCFQARLSKAKLVPVPVQLNNEAAHAPGQTHLLALNWHLQSAPGLEVTRQEDVLENLAWSLTTDIKTDFM